MSATKRRRKVREISTRQVNAYTEPANWRETAQRKYPDATQWVTPHDWATIPWADVNFYIRSEIAVTLNSQAETGSTKPTAQKEIRHAQSPD